MQELLNDIECEEKKLIAKVLSDGIKNNELKRLNKNEVAEIIINIRVIVKYN